MDKLQMTVTLSEPELLAYLRQFSGARDRSFILRRLALRGLQAGGPGGLDDPLLPPMAGPVQGVPESTPFANAPVVVREQAQAEPVRPLQGPPSLSPPSTATATPGGTPPVLPPSEAKVASDGQLDPLAGLDIDALNDAMARY